MCLLMAKVSQGGCKRAENATTCTGLPNKEKKSKTNASPAGDHGRREKKGNSCAWLKFIHNSARRSENITSDYDYDSSQ